MSASVAGCGTLRALTQALDSAVTGLAIEGQEQIN